MSFVRRYLDMPDIDTMLEIEGIVIIDRIPAGVFTGRRLGTVGLVGEWAKGPYNEPTLVEGDQTILNTFGGFKLAVTDPLSFSTNPYSNGNAYCWLRGKKFRRLILCRPNLELANGVTITLAGTPSTTTQKIVIPAGTRIYKGADLTHEYALAEDLIFAEGVVVGSGPQAFTRGLAQTVAQITGVPVFSTKGVSDAGTATVTSINAADLFRAGLGTGTALPSQTLAVTNPGTLTVLTESQIEAAYQAALDALMPGSNPLCDNIEIVASARTSDAIRTALKNNANDASARGVGRTTVIRPPIGTDQSEATAGSDPGVGGHRADVVDYCMPHFKQVIPEIAQLDPAETISPSTILIGADAAMATLLSNLAPEENPAQDTNEIVSGGLLDQFIVDIEEGLTTVGQPTNWTIDNYIAFLAAGICALRRDGSWLFQSGVTAVDPSVYPQLAPIKRRRMAFWIQDSLAIIAKSYNKKLRTTNREESLLGEFVDFLEPLLGKDGGKQRILAYSIDGTSGNSEALTGVGLKVYKISVQLIDDFRAIVLDTTIGETVTVVSADMQTEV